MDSSPVNWETLDSLILQFAQSENLIEDTSPVSSPSSSSSLSSSSPSSSPPLSSYNSRLLVRRISRFLQLGDIDSVINLLRLHAPTVLDDHRLLFRLHKQKFIELLRRGTKEDRDAAINCLRTALAPSALNAYPEAYEEFKHVILAFIYDKNDQTSPVADEWSEKRRFDIAGLMSSVLRAHLHAYDPVFAMAMRYLISTHNEICFRQGIASPISYLTERLLLEERDLGAIPHESLYESPPFDEVDVQALANAVKLTRQGAVDSLRFAKGDLLQAFQNELCRMKLDISFLDELVHEYCVYRGIVDSDTASGTSSSEVEGETSKHGGKIMMINSHMDVSTDTDVMSTQNIDTGERYPCDTTSNHECCSTSGISQPEVSNLLQRKRRPGILERDKRKRWKGRCEDSDCVPEVMVQSREQDLSTSMAFQKSFTLGDKSDREDKYETVLELKELVIREMAAEVVEAIKAIDPDFLELNPVLLFQLKQLEFLKLVRSGDNPGALKVAAAFLGPLGARDPALLKPLKETLLTLLKPNEATLGKGLPLYAIATSLQVAIGRRLGIEEPRLMKIIRETLSTHTESFKLQRCKDRFEGLLKIDSLKEIRISFLADDASKSNSEACTNDSSQVTDLSSSGVQEDGSSQSQVSFGDVICQESAILKVMEFLDLPRAEAIQLLLLYGGDAETVIEQLFT